MADRKKSKPKKKQWCHFWRRRKRSKFLYVRDHDDKKEKEKRWFASCFFAQKFLIAGGRVPACGCVMWWDLTPNASGVTCFCIYFCVRVITWHDNSGNNFSFQRPPIHINCTAVPEKGRWRRQTHFYGRFNHVSIVFVLLWQVRVNESKTHVCSSLHLILPPIQEGSAALSFCSTTYVVRMLSFGHNWSSRHHCLF